MIICEKCGHENPPGELICTRCDALLVDRETKDAENGITRRLDNVIEGLNVPRWGTAQLGRERKLLLHIRGYDKPLLVELTDMLVMGRCDTTTGEMPHVDLTEYGAEEEGVSRRHAAIIFEDDALKIVDLGSANATHINGQKLIAHQSRILRDGDELRLGHLVMHLHFI